MNQHFYIFLYSAFLSLAKFRVDAYIPLRHFGRCPYVEPMPNFIPLQFQGVWNLAGGYNTQTLASDKCASTDFILDKPNSNRFSFHIKEPMPEGDWSWVNGTGVVANTYSRDGVLQANIRGAKVDFYIIDTDYYTHAVVYTCWEDRGAHDFAIWIVSRDKVLRREDYPGRLIYAFVRELGLSPSFVKSFDQRDCPN